MTDERIARATAFSLTRLQLRAGTRRVPLMRMEASLLRYLVQHEG